MNDRVRYGMREASVLTGRLTEATAVLRRALQSGRDRTTVEPLPEPLRRFLDRFTRTGVAPDPRGFAEPSPPDICDRPEGGQFVAKSYGNQAGTRAYKLYVPRHYRGQPLPLIIMLHGCTQSPDDFAAGTRMNLRAEEHDCFVAYPAQPASANVSKCWNWFRPGDQQRGRGEPSLIAGITRQVIGDYAIDEKRVYAAGLSAGGAAAAILAETYPDLYAAIGVHSGLACGLASDVPSAFAAMRQSQPAARRRSGDHAGRRSHSETVPAIVFHGDQDTTVHPHNGDQIIAQLREALNADLRVTVQRDRVPGGRAYVRTIHEDPSGLALFEQWVVHGAGHAWSGGSSAGSFTDPQGPDATREMLRFFLEHPRSF
jgi:poly(hydroxyalkanoate) depolymerase family esterase